MQRLSWNFPYPSQRMPVFARNVVATSQPLAAQAGLQMLHKGGNAVDAAIATAITLTVVEPNMNGIGSDAFAILSDATGLHGLNASGRAPSAWNLGRFKGIATMPARGWDTVTVPGAVSAWVALSGKFGKLPFADLFAPAIRYARDGFAVPPITATSWALQAQELRAWPDFAAAFLPRGCTPRAGEIFRFPDQANTLERIAETGGKAFYEGDLAEKIVAHSKQSGGAIRLEDLARHRAEWVTPLSQNYRGVTLHEIPPNGQGLAALITLGILEHWRIVDYPVDSADSIHLQIEAMKLGFADAYRYVGDPEAMELDPARLLESSYLRERARLIDPRRAQHYDCGVPRSSGTVYLCAADASGMQVSMIQSNYMGFGSGIVVPGTGISLQNRGHGFKLEPGHPNCVAGGKRPFHTIIPGFVTREGEPLMAFGVMGGMMQPQGHTQVMVRMIDYSQNPQAALDGPRWQLNPEFDASFEAGFGQGTIQELRRRGHRIPIGQPIFNFGGGQAILRVDGGYYCAASDHRKDGQAVGF